MAIEINLLPWREARRLRARQRFTIFSLTGLVVVVLLCLVVNYSVFTRIETRRSANQTLKQELAILNKKLAEIKQIKTQKSKLVKKIFYLDKLQSNQVLVNHLFAELIELLPDGVYLNFLGKSKNKVTLQGVSESNIALTQLIKNIEKNPWMKSANLAEIKKEKPLIPINHFRVNFILNPDKVGGL